MAFAARGLVRGLVSQAFALLGLAAGLLIAGWIAQWVGWRWHAARPAVAFGILRWAIVIFAALATAALFRWWGHQVRSALHATPAGWIDRSGGLLLGAGLGGMAASLIILGAILTPWPHGLVRSAARSQMARPLMSGGVLACERVARVVPGSRWLTDWFRAAERRMRGAQHS